jgi:hypothetical protein
MCVYNLVLNGAAEFVANATRNLELISIKCSQFGNTETAKGLNIAPVLDKIQKCSRNWLQHINSMPHNRLLRILNNCRPTGRRNQGRLLNRLLKVRDQNGSTNGSTAC